MAAYYPTKPTIEDQTKMKELIKNFSIFYPCNICAKHLRDELVVAILLNKNIRIIGFKKKKNRLFQPNTYNVTVYS